MFNIKVKEHVDLFNFIISYLKNQVEKYYYTHDEDRLILQHGQWLKAHYEQDPN